VQALAQAYLDYYGAVADANRAQFRLYRALGQPAQALVHDEHTPALAPTVLPPAPPVNTRDEVAPPPRPVPPEALPKPAKPERPGAVLAPLPRPLPAESLASPTGATDAFLSGTPLPNLKPN